MLEYTSNSKCSSSSLKHISLNEIPTTISWEFWRQQMSYTKTSAVVLKTGTVISLFTQYYFKWNAHSTEKGLWKFISFFSTLLSNYHFTSRDNIQTYYLQVLHFSAFGRRTQSSKVSLTFQIFFMTFKIMSLSLDCKIKHF